MALWISEDTIASWFDMHCQLAKSLLDIILSFKNIMTQSIPRNSAVVIWHRKKKRGNATNDLAAPKSRPESNRTGLGSTRFMTGQRRKYFERKMWLQLQQEWQKISTETLRSYIDTMPERCRAVIEANGGHTRY